MKKYFYAVTVGFMPFVLRWNTTNARQIKILSRGDTGPNDYLDGGTTERVDVQ
ncbi:MAG: hypothetical protein IPL50_10340 [Chitinophagaceae bacterium]|nr:hypothetical protein [Chitinophagaceae bacterium]